MDSQDQYEALLRAWGFEDRSEERHARREKIAQSAQMITTFLKSAFHTSRKSDSHAASH